MPWFRVDAERNRQGTFYIQAETQEIAQQEADNLADDFFDDCDYADSVYVQESRSIPPVGSEYWTGGRDGYWEITTDQNV